MKTLKALIFALTIPVLLLAAAGCKEPGTDTKYPPSNITVTYANDNPLPAGALALAIDAELELKVSANGATSYEWDIDDSAKVELVEGANGATAKFKGLAEGSTNIIAIARNKDGSISKPIPVTVSAIPSVSLSIKEDGGSAEIAALDMEKDETITLVATVTPNDAAVTWESNDEAIVTVDDGEVTALKAGHTTITVTASKDGYTSATKTIAVEVTDPTLPYLTLTLKNGNDVVDEDNGIELMAGTNLTLSTEVVSGVSPVTGVTFDWESGSTSIATVSNDGTVTAVAVGDTTITVIASKEGYNDSNSVEFTVTVTAIPILPWNWAKTPVWTSLTNGNNNRFFSTGRDDVTIRVYGGTIANDNGGIDLSGTASGLPRLVIGQYDNLPTVAKGEATVSPINGDFDLAEGPVKVTVTYENLRIATDGDPYLFRVYVNNNGTGQANSFLGNASNIITYWKPSSTQNGPKLSDTSGTIEVIIDPSTFTAAQLPALEKAFICFHAQGGTGNNGLTITSITIERIQTAGIVIDNEADFTGFPTEPFTLSSSAATKAITLTGTGYTSADWYINGVKQSPSGMSFNVSKGTLVSGEHTLTAVVTINGQLYSTSVKFTVAE